MNVTSISKKIKVDLKDVQKVFKNAFKKDFGLFLAVRYDTESTQIINEFKKSLGIQNNTTYDYHTTIMYSVNNLRKLKIETIFGGKCSKLRVPIQFKKLDVFDTPKGKCVVLRVQSEFLLDEFNRCIKAGAKYTYDSYLPHITLAYVNDEKYKEIKQKIAQINKEYGPNKKDVWLYTKEEYLDITD